MNLLSLLPSQVQALKNSLKDEVKKVEFLEALSKVVDGELSDIGQEQDNIFCAAVMLTSEKIWQHISAKEVAEALSKGSESKRIVFISGLPRDFAEEICSSYVSDDISVPGLEAAADRLEAIGNFYGWFPKGLKSWRKTNDSIAREEFLDVVAEIIREYKKYDKGL